MKRKMMKKIGFYSKIYTEVKDFYNIEIEVDIDKNKMENMIGKKMNLINIEFLTIITGIWLFF